MASTHLEEKQAQFGQILAQETQRGALRNVTVGHFMTPQPMTLRTTTNAFELIQLVHQRRFRHLLVANEQDQLVGVISDRDLIRCFGLEEQPSRDQLEQIRARDLMSEDLITVTPATPLFEAVGLILAHGINCLPVVAGGRAVGILTSTDLYVVLEQVLQVDHSAVSC